MSVIETTAEAVSEEYSPSIGEAVASAVLTGGALIFGGRLMNDAYTWATGSKHAPASTPAPTPAPSTGSSARYKQRCTVYADERGWLVNANRVYVNQAGFPVRPGEPAIYVGDVDTEKWEIRDADDLLLAEASRDRRGPAPMAPTNPAGRGVSITVGNRTYSASVTSQVQPAAQGRPCQTVWDSATGKTFVAVSNGYHKVKNSDGTWWEYPD